ncbi:MAG: hypothetical protein KIG70_05945 [Treponema sp.]|uniref:hypothetical protein n=1 Tax=Treponema sp. TaxID=166 RepID=UPI001D7D785F|nr:hypothetical protein [Treponema sp.]MBS7310712.1 hypothetical protein [Treponema sp.]
MNRKEKFPSTIHFDLTSDYYYGSFLYDFVSIKMKEYIDESNINLELNLIQHIGKTMELLQFC